MTSIKPFDPAEYLDSPEMIAAYVAEAIESNDSAQMAVAICAVAKARGMQMDQVQEAKCRLTRLKY